MILLPEPMRNRLPFETMDYPVMLERYGYILLASQSLIHVPEEAEKPAIRIPRPLIGYCSGTSPFSS